VRDTEVRVDAEPFALGPEKAETAVLCLHGLTGTPYEVRPLAEAFAAAGLRALGPALPGHASSPEALAAVGSWHDWVDAARADLRDLTARHARVFVAGLSMGGLIALLLASERLVDALVVVGVPLRLPMPLPWVVPFAKRVVPFVGKDGGSDIQDDAARARHPSYDRMPLHAVHELTKLQQVVRGRLRQIAAPILVAHGALDRTADPRDATRIYQGVASPERELLLLSASGHVVPVDRDGAQLARAAGSFLARHASPLR
jgi:carboxylesterase